MRYFIIYYVVRSSYPYNYQYGIMRLKSETYPSRFKVTDELISMYSTFATITNIQELSEQDYKDFNS